MIRIGMEDGAIPTGHGVLHVRRITIITAMDLVRHGIRLRPGLIDLTVRHLPEAPRVAALARRTTGTRLPEVECHVPAIWVVAVAIPLPQHHRHQAAAVGRIAAVVEADRMVVVATVEAEVEAVVVVDKAIGNSLHI